jgi:lipopolysaccharide export LptBFGC system permease protein LptF
VALTVWIVAQFGGRAISGRAATFVVAAAVALSAVSFVCHGWLTPTTNQAYRAAYAHRAGWQTPPTRGFPELTFGEVRELRSWALRNPGVLSAQNLHYLAVSYEGRLAASFAPIVFAVFALLIAPWRGWLRWPGAVVACVAYLGYLLSLNESNLTAIDGRWLGGAAWYPLVALAVPIVAMLCVHLVLARRSPAGASA